jgi:hypothetical protein
MLRHSIPPRAPARGGEGQGGGPGHSRCPLGKARPSNGRDRSGAPPTPDPSPPQAGGGESCATPPPQAPATSPRRGEVGRRPGEGGSFPRRLPLSRRAARVDLPPPGGGEGAARPVCRSEPKFDAIPPATPLRSRASPAGVCPSRSPRSREKARGVKRRQARRRTRLLAPRVTPRDRTSMPKPAGSRGVRFLRSFGSPDEASGLPGCLIGPPTTGMLDPGRPKNDPHASRRASRRFTAAFAITGPRVRGERVGRAGPVSHQLAPAASRADRRGRPLLPTVSAGRTRRLPASPPPARA